MSMFSWMCDTSTMPSDSPSTSQTQQIHKEEIDPIAQQEQAARALFQLSTTYSTSRSHGGGHTSSNKKSRPTVSRPYPEMHHPPSSQSIDNDLSQGGSNGNGQENSGGRHVCTFDGCTKTFTSADKLSRHFLTHSDLKPHLCSTCGKGFGRSDHLAKHIRVHTGEKPFICAVCGKSFARSDKLNTHNKVHYKGQL